MAISCSFGPASCMPLPSPSGGPTCLPERSGISVRRAAGAGPGRRAGLCGVRCDSRRPMRHARASGQADRASAEAANRHRGGRTRHLRGPDAAHVAGRTGAPSAYGANAGSAVFQGRDGADVREPRDVGVNTRAADGGGRLVRNAAMAASRTRRTCAVFRRGFGLTPARRSPGSEMIGSTARQAPNDSLCLSFPRVYSTAFECPAPPGQSRRAILVGVR